MTTIRYFVSCSKKLVPMLLLGNPQSEAGASKRKVPREHGNRHFISDHSSYFLNRIRYFFVLFVSVFVLSNFSFAQTIIVDHNCTDVNEIPDEWIGTTKERLHVVYQHTSHGSQIVTGMNALEKFPAFGTKYEWDDKGAVAGALDMDDCGIWRVSDLSQGDSVDSNGVTPWVTATRELLDNSENYHVNVIVWSWCSIDGHDIPRYLENMEILISEYGEGGSNPRASDHPVKFVFMTGHAEGQGEDGFVYNANRQIRNHCTQYGRILYDFADIESYNPDGEYFYDRAMTDNLDYTNVSYRDSNWASEWIAANEGSELERLTTGNGTEGYDGCSGCAHSDDPAEANLNCVLKGRAFWWLLARIAGWEPGSASSAGDIDIRGGGPQVSIPNGDTTPSVSDGSDFGVADVSATVVGNFEIANTGSANLELTGSPAVEITGAHAEDFVLTASPKTTISPNETEAFQISFSPGDAGLRQAVVTVASNESIKKSLFCMIRLTILFQPSTYTYQQKSAKNNYKQDFKVKTNKTKRVAGRF